MTKRDGGYYIGFYDGMHLLFTEGVFPMTVELAAALCEKRATEYADIFALGDVRPVSEKAIRHARIMEEVIDMGLIGGGR